MFSRRNVLYPASVATLRLYYMEASLSRDIHGNRLFISATVALSDGTWDPPALRHSYTSQYAN